MAGWRFDFCENCDGIVSSVKKNKFDYGKYRNQSEDKEQLGAIDNFCALEFSDDWRDRTRRKRKKK